MSVKKSLFKPDGGGDFLRISTVRHKTVAIERDVLASEFRKMFFGTRAIYMKEGQGAVRFY